MNCAISGQPCVDAVVTRHGHVFERRVLLAHLASHGHLCPITGQHINEEELVTVQTNRAVRPRPVSTTSIPSMIAAFQNEWDELMLETFTLKQHLDKTREELSQALYQQDAASRVIARLMRERDEARTALQNIHATYNSNATTANNNNNHHNNSNDKNSTNGNGNHHHNNNNESVLIEEEGISEAVIEKINSKCKELSTLRKARKPKAEGHLSKQTLAAFALHSTTPAFSSSLTSIAVSSNDNNSNGLVLVGSTDGKAYLTTTTTTSDVVSTFSGHNDRVTAVAFHPSTTATRPGSVFTASADNTVKIWSSDSNNNNSITTITAHSKAVSSLNVHPTGDYLVTTSFDNSWSLINVSDNNNSNNRILRSVRSNDDVNSNSNTGLLTGSMHPDGLIFATSVTSHLSHNNNNNNSSSWFHANADSNSFLRVWDLRDQKVVATFGNNNNNNNKLGVVGCLQFSENGYYLASGGNDGFVRVWDLRKLECTKTIQVGDKVSSVSFDPSGLYLAVASSNNNNNNNNNNLRLFHTKDWASVLDVASEGEVSALAWNNNSTSLFSSSFDKTVRVYQ